MPSKLEALLKHLSDSEDFHLEVGLRMLKADGGALFPLDLLAKAVLNRSTNLIPAFVYLIESKNFIAAAPLLRLQIDNCIRFHGAWLADNPHEFASAVLKGEHIGRLKDRIGNKMTDRYLLENFANEFPWVTTVYERTSGYIHLSDAHIGNLFAGSTSFEDGTTEFKWGRGDNFPDDSLYIEAVEAFIAATEAMFHYITGWIKTKEGEPGRQATASPPPATGRTTMAPIILPNTGVPWIFLILGLILLLVGIVATMARRLEVRQRVGLVGTGIVVIVIGLMASKSRIELHDDKIVQRIQMILPKRTEIKLDGITEVAVVEYEESGKAKESWFFSRDKEAGPTIVATGLWKGHSETIIKFLREKGIKVTRQKSR